LDEVHSLTPEAWQSLLKTLEEPRDNCIFIMATTDPEKIPDTILSRAVSLTVRRIKAVDIAANLKKICEQQKIKYEESALHTIAKKSGGIMRDSVKDLDTVYSVFGEVTSKNVMEIFSVVDLAVITSFIQTVFSEPVSVVLNETRSIENLFPNSQRFLIKLYETLLDCVKLKLGVDLTSVYSADEIQQMQQVITFIPTKFLWQFINVIKEQLDDFNPDLPVLDYVALAMKKDKVEDSLGVSEKKEVQKFNLEASIDDI
jgi:DNA polymerase-3 subunit gamma/tau